MQISDDIFLGPALGPNPNFGSDGNPAPMSQGVGPMGRIYVYDVVPVTLQAAGLAASQAVATARNLTLTAGTGVTTVVDATGVTRYVLDVPRCVTAVSANAGDTTQTITITGYDAFGQLMTSRVTLNGTTTVVSTKAFKSVISMAISAATAGNVSAGFNDRIGMPVRVTDAAYIVRAGYNNVVADDASVFVSSDATNPATVLTGDVRGLLTPSSAFNGSKRLVLALAVPALGAGPQATRIGAFGVTQA